MKKTRNNARSHCFLAQQVQRYQCLVSLMLSSQTKDEVNFAAMTRLKEFGLTPERMARTSEKQIGELIYPVGFWKVREMGESAKIVLYLHYLCNPFRFIHDCLYFEEPVKVTLCALSPGAILGVTVGVLQFPIPAKRKCALREEKIPPTEKCPR